MNKIAIISPYFGKFPTNIKQTLISMKNNKFIDWYIYTDNNIESYEKNIFIKKITFTEIKKIIKEKIGTNIIEPYKLCDYKVTYGFLFEDILKKYDFWGYCDIDIIFGDLTLLFNDRNLNEYDKILDLGHLSIYKNIEKIKMAFTNIYRKNMDYKKILNSQYIWGTDERYSCKEHYSINEVIEEFDGKILNNDLRCVDVDIKYNNFYPNFYSNYEKRKKTYYFKYEDKKLYLMQYKKKELKKEIVYVHLQQKKQIPILTSSEDFNIFPKMFTDNDKCSKKFFYMKDLKLWWYIKFRIKRKIKNIKKRKELF